MSIQEPRGRVLVLDDEKNIVIVLRTILEKRGFVVEGFTSSLDALQVVQNKEFDAVVTDLFMPEMDGMEFLNRVSELRPKMPVVMITAFGTVDTAVDAIKAGAFDYVTKPFEQSEICAVIEKATNTNRLRRLELIHNPETKVVQSVEKPLEEEINKRGQQGSEEFGEAVRKGVKSGVRYVQGQRKTVTPDNSNMTAGEQEPGSEDSEVIVKRPRKEVLMEKASSFVGLVSKNSSRKRSLSSKDSIVREANLKNLVSEPAIMEYYLALEDVHPLDMLELEVSFKGYKAIFASGGEKNNQDTQAIVTYNRVDSYVEVLIGQNFNGVIRFGTQGAIAVLEGQVAYRLPDYIHTNIAINSPAVESLGL